MHWPVTFVDCKIRQVMLIHHGYTHRNAPALRTSSALYLPAPTYLGDKDNSVVPYVRVNVCACVGIKQQRSSSGLK